MTTMTTASGELTAQAPLSEPAAEAWLPRICFKHGPPGRLGIELELLPVPADPPRPLREAVVSRAPGGVQAPAELRAGLARLPLHGALTIEPGGQVELSSRTGSDLPAVLAEVSADLRLLRRRAAALGWRLAGIGLDPVSTPSRILDLPRYAAMEAYLDGWGAVGGCGPASRLMMCATAAVQVNVEAATSAGSTTSTGSTGAAAPGGADPSQVAQRWELLHAVAPALVAAFANSSLRRGRPTGWKSTRQAVWLTLDPARTRAPRRRPGEGVAQAWARWCLDAPVMLVRRPQGPWTAPRGLTFRQWIRSGRQAVPDRRPPGLDDLAYHLTTLFPPVRARGYLEIRYLDAQPGPWWAVPPAVIAALMDDERAADQARDACAPVQGRWADAARVGLDDPDLARAAERVLGLAAASLSGRATTAPAARMVEAYAERWTLRRRCPADDLLAGVSVSQGVPPVAEGVLS